jgi:hypothetical protein
LEGKGGVNSYFLLIETNKCIPLQKNDERMNLHYKFIIVIITIFLLCQCGSNRFQMTNSNVVVDDEIIILDNDISTNDSNDFENTIVDLMEPKIKYRDEFGNPVTNIIIQNPNIKTELNGFAMVVITFNCMDSLHIVNVEIRSLQMKEIINDSIVFDYSIFINKKKNKAINFYSKKLETIIRNLKFWIEEDDKKRHNLYLSINKRFLFFFKVRVIPGG